MLLTKLLLKLLLLTKLQWAQKALLQPKLLLLPLKAQKLLPLVQKLLQPKQLLLPAKPLLLLKKQRSKLGFTLTGLIFERGRRKVGPFSFAQKRGTLNGCHIPARLLFWPPQPRCPFPPVVMRHPPMA